MLTPTCPVAMIIMAKASGILLNGV